MDYIVYLYYAEKVCVCTCQFLCIGMRRGSRNSEKQTENNMYCMTSFKTKNKNSFVCLCIFVNAYRKDRKDTF